jgi:hypothetical protein
MRETFTSGSVGRAPGNRCLYPESDGEQPPLVPRCGCSPRLKRGVAMTSDVKGWKQLFYVRSIVLSFCLSEEPEPGKHDG